MDPAVTWLVSLGAAIIFIASSAMKLRDLGMFESAVDNYRILPELLVKPLAYLIPLIELIAAIAIAAPPSRTAGAAVLLALLAAFTLAIVVNLARGRYDVDCGCFGPALKQTLSWWLVARNGALAIVLALALLPEAARPLDPLDGVTIGFGVATLIVLYVSINYVFANIPRLRELRARYA
ncbi:MAG: MauE/DoxX family redox-associated membrane protein [Candidatus Binataceae bacterium]